MHSDGRGAWKKRGSDYLSFFYLSRLCIRSFRRESFFWTDALSVRPSKHHPYRETAGWTDKRKASARVLGSPQAHRMKPSEGMNAKRKTEATAGKQKGPAKGAKSVKASPETLNFNSLGKFHPSKFSAPDKDGKRILRKRRSVATVDEVAERKWPRMLRLASDELAAANYVAQLAVQLCALKKEAQLENWKSQSKDYENQRNKLSGLPDQQERLDKKRGEQTAEYLRLLNAAGYLAEAWDLLENARTAATRPQSEVEYLVAHGGTTEALKTVIGKRDRDERIPFVKLCDPERNEGDTETRFGVTWKVYTGRNDDLKKRDPSAGFILIGLFSAFEAWRGWCAIHACRF